MSNLPKAIEQFSEWRKAKRGGQRIPKELWDIACALAAELDVISVARALGLSSHQLRLKITRKDVKHQDSDVLPFPVKNHVIQRQVVIAELEIKSGLKVRIYQGISAIELQSLFAAIAEAI